MRRYFYAAGFVALLGGSCPGQDFDGNFTPDSTQRRNGAPDCNHNGFLDSVDISRPHFSVGVEHLNGVWQFINDTSDVQPIDFDNDGDMDIVALSIGPSQNGFASLWRNDGGPGLTWVADVRGNDWIYPWSVRVADLNGDGRSDMVVGDGGVENVYVVLATGEATFATPVTLVGSASNNGMMRIAVGDLDNDGDMDIVAPNVGMDIVDVWRNNGAGVFGSRASFPTGDSPTSVAIGDFTGDGLADIAVANRFLFAPTGTPDGTVTLLRNTGTAFTTHATLTMPTNSAAFGVMHPRPWDIALVDHDHDGDLDMIVSSDDSQRLDLFTNGGAGAFALAGSIGRGWYLESSAARFVVADFDGDGWEDVAWGNTDAHGVDIYMNQRNGLFAFKQAYGMGNNSGVSLCAADLNSDGLLDLVSANGASRTFNVAIGTGSGLFDAPIRRRPAEYPSQSMIGDFNNDGINDHAAHLQSQTASIGIAVYLGNGDGTMAATPIITPTPTVGRFLARDINEDGTLDLIELVGRCNVYIGNGDGTFQAPIVNPVIALLRNVITDINQDGHLDLVWISSGHPGQLYRSLGDGAGHFGAATLVGEVPAEDEEIAFGDITGDGAPEIFTGHRQGLSQPGGIFSVYPNNADGTFGARQDRFIVGTPLSPAVNAISCADFDGDGDNDVIVSANGLRMYRNPGDGNLPALPEVVSSSGASILRAYDIDLDGDMDLYGRGSVGVAFFNSGNGMMSPSFLPGYDSNGRNMVIGDWNNDTRPDMLFEPENSWYVFVFLNQAQWSRDDDGNGVPDECEGMLRCDSIDFNNDTSRFDPQDIEAFLSVYSEGPCVPDWRHCNDIDFNNDRSIFDPRDIEMFLSVYSGGPCR